MISRIRGTITRWDVEAGTIEVDIGPLCYEVTLPAFTMRALEETSSENVELFTYYHVTERNPTPVLVGFLRPIEREFFKKFISVPGMGVSKATKALTTSISTIARWIEDEDEAALKQLPGVGARAAGQIVAELRGKVVEEALLRDEQFVGPLQPGPPVLHRVVAEAVAALEGLGYRRAEARDLVDATMSAAEDGSSLDLEAIMRAVLESQAPSG